MNELTRLHNELARVHGAQAQLKLEEQYLIAQLEQLARKALEGGERRGKHGS